MAERSDGAASGLLAGVRVLDLSIWRPGPYATQLLAELGADVVKVEPPGGDPMRVYAGLFAALHAGKRSVELDLNAETDRATALELAAGADVVIEGFRPGVAARLGMGYEQVRAVNPEIVYCSVSGFGQTGPLSAVSGHDLNYLAWAGALAPDGGIPRESAVPIADLSGGMAAALGICAALVRRDRTGEGEWIDVGMADVLATWTGTVPPTAEGVDPSARGVPGYGTFEAADGFVTLAMLSEDHFWSGLCAVLGLDEVAHLGFVERCARLDELQAAIAAAISARGRDELVEALLAARVPAAPVLTREEMSAAPHFRVRGSVVGGPEGQARSGHPVRYERHPARLPGRVPRLDEHRGSGWLPRD
jgi:crotonobetainyl-CoA:carnitine CoA-transferase CaiB-like acyl-CoA transferase